MSKPFKMKGSPMQRNFGVGGPAKYTPHANDPRQTSTGGEGSTPKASGQATIQAPVAYKSPAKQKEPATPVDPKKVAAWQEKQKAACAAKSGHEWRDGSCWGPGEYAAHQKRIADVKKGK